MRTKIIEKMQLEFNINNEQILQLDHYQKILEEYNQKMNLTNITEVDQVYEKHFWDSLIPAQYISFSSQKVIDIGSGAGFPGIVLKIIFPDIELIIIEALNKRVKFLETVCQELDLKNVKIIHQRAEEIDIIQRESADIVISRAVARMPILVELCLPYLKVKGIFVAMKGVNYEDELKLSEKLILEMGCQIKNIQKVKLPYEKSMRSLLLIEKINSTPSKFPRKYAIIKNN